jgi:hypothetical protein
LPYFFFYARPNVFPTGGRVALLLKKHIKSKQSFYKKGRLKNKKSGAYTQVPAQQVASFYYLKHKYIILNLIC